MGPGKHLLASGFRVVAGGPWRRRACRGESERCCDVFEAQTVMISELTCCGIRRPSLGIHTQRMIKGTLRSQGLHVVAQAHSRTHTHTQRLTSDENQYIRRTDSNVPFSPNQ